MLQADLLGPTHADRVVESGDFIDGKDLQTACGILASHALALDLNQSFVAVEAFQIVDAVLEGVFEFLLEVEPSRVVLVAGFVR